MMETDLLVDKSLHPMYGNGKKKRFVTEKQRKRAEWMEKNHKKWLECFSWKALVIHELRCRVKSLAEEARMTRKEEQRASLMYSGILRHHRIDKTRENARYAQLALAFVRGRPYCKVEGEYNKGVSLSRLSKEVRDYASCCFTNIESDVLVWLSGKRS